MGRAINTHIQLISVLLKNTHIIKLSYILQTLVEVHPVVVLVSE